MSATPNSLTLIMPVYNEAGCIEQVVRAWIPFFEKIPGLMVVVNDGSKDSTGQILKGLSDEFSHLKVITQSNAGHGAAVLRGYREAVALNSDFTFQTDSDDQFRPDDFWKLWERRDQSNFITGYRQAREDALHRKVITKVVIFLNSLLFGVFLKDANVPYRLIRTNYLRDLLFLLPNDVFAPNIFLTVLAKKSGSRLFEIPISHEDRKTGEVSIIKWNLLKACFRCTKELLLFRISVLTNRSSLKSLKSRYA